MKYILFGLIAAWLTSCSGDNRNSAPGTGTPPSSAVVTRPSHSHAPPKPADWLPASASYTGAGG